MLPLVYRSLAELAIATVRFVIVIATVVDAIRGGIVLDQLSFESKLINITIWIYIIAVSLFRWDPLLIIQPWINSTCSTVVLLSTLNRIERWWVDTVVKRRIGLLQKVLLSQFIVHLIFFISLLLGNIIYLRHVAIRLVIESTLRYTISGTGSCCVSNKAATRLLLINL